MNGRGPTSSRAAAGPPGGTDGRDIARRLADPGLTTTVLTSTVTGLVADDTSWSVRLRQAVPVLAMLAGAFAGGAPLRSVDTGAPLWAAAALLVCSATAAHVATRRAHSEVWA